MTGVVDYASFKLSRIYTQGRNAARCLPAHVRSKPEAMAELNPHTEEPARTRWNEGFSKAME